MDIKKDFKNLQTTVMGILAGLMMLIPQVQNLLDGNPETTLSETAVLSALALMGFGVVSGDGDKNGGKK